jgi:hypothetical protein
MNLLRRRSFSTLALALVAGASSLGAAGCGSLPPSQVLSDIVAGVEQAQVVLAQIQAYVDAYAGLDAALKTKIEAALADARGALAALVALGQTVSDITDARFQDALTAFAAAFAAVVALGTEIGVQVNGAHAAASSRVAGARSIQVPEPILLRLRVTRAGPTPARAR